MARNYILPKEGNFYKANLHCHTSSSDGRFTAEKMKEAYMEKGYSIVAYTDHNVLIPHNELSNDKFLAITATEINFDDTSSDWANMKTYHINFYSKDKDRTEFIPFERVYDKTTIQDVINRANEAGFLVQYNHPRWSFQTQDDFCDLEGLFAFEVFNYGCETEMHNGWGDFEYECFCQYGGRATTVATDDNHNFSEDTAHPHSDSFGGFTMIKAPSLGYDDILTAMENKNCYASTGPEIYEIYVDAENGKETVHVSCSGVSSICIRSESRRTSIKRSNTDDITSYEVTFEQGQHKYFRIECIDSNGGKAMSRAFFTDEFIRD